MQQKVLIIDNYDSFTYNLVYLVKKVSNTAPVVLRNDGEQPGGGAADECGVG